MTVEDAGCTGRAPAVVMQQEPADVLLPEPVVMQQEPADVLLPEQQAGCQQQRTRQGQPV